MKKFGEFIFQIVLAAISLVVAGLVVRYGWNNFVSPAFAVPYISLPAAIGLDLIITYITGYATPGSVEELYSGFDGTSQTIIIFTYGVLKSLVTFVAMFLVTQFI